MKITRIEAYQVDLPLKEGRYSWSDGRSVDVFDSTVVRISTDSGIEGFGEVCPLGPTYLPAFAAGARAGIAQLAPHLIGCDPTKIGPLYRKMEAELKGHPYIKSAIDMACWDILGKEAGLPVCELLGGRVGDAVNFYRAITQLPPAQMAANVAGFRKEGYRRFQLKVGGDADVDIERIHAARAILEPSDTLVADANCGWRPHEAARVVRAVRNLNVYIEQPCPTYEECLSVRQRTDLPFILDECVDSAAMLVRAASERACDVVNLKISKLGGLTPARLARDLCAELGIAMTIEDTWGGDIVTAAIAHLSQSTPADLRFSSTDFNSYGTVTIADGAPKRINGQMSASTAPGLGVTPRLDVLGKAIISVS